MSLPGMRRGPPSSPNGVPPGATSPVNVSLVPCLSPLRGGTLALVVGLVAACSSSSDGGAGTEVELASVVQDLIEDRDGTTVVISVPGFADSLTTGNVQASAGQTALSVAVSGDEATVTFDERVTPSHQVRVVGVDGLSDAWRAVATTDPRVPRMGIMSATQDVSDGVLGGDQIVVAFIAGPRVAEEQAEDPSNWTLRVSGVTLDLTGSTFVLEPNSQVLTMTLGPRANLHSTFTLATDIATVADTALSTAALPGTATGDSTPPSLDGGTPVFQDIAVPTGDAYGTVAVIDFSEPISPVFGATASNFTVVDHVNAVGVTTVTRVAVDPTDNSRVRVSFSRPVVPGLDQISIGGVLDAHGNPFTPQVAALSAGSTVPNGFASVDFVTVEGLGNDRVVATLDQAIDPDTAEDPARWTLDVGGNPVDLGTQEIDYDLVSRTVTIDLDFDVPNGTTADLTAAGVVDVDGETFNAAAPQAAASGDATAPTVGQIVQNRTVDGSGHTVDVTFDEALDVATATDTANYVFTPAIVVSGATLINGSAVRLTLQDVAVPGDFTLTVLQAVSDPAGNDLGADVGPATFTSTDTVPPTLVTSTATAVEGVSNDTVVAFFGDVLVQADIEDTLRWAIESPVGTPLDLTGSSVVYDAGSGVATLTLDGASLVVGDDFEVTITGARDIGGNAATTMDGGGVAGGEAHRPTLDGVFLTAAANQLNVRFSEPMGALDDLYDGTTNPYGPRYELVDAVTSDVSLPTAATVEDDGLGVVLTYPVDVDPADTVNVVGTRDPAGNTMFPAMGVAPAAFDAGEPTATGAAPAPNAVAGVDNDRITFTFDRPVASWRATDPANYTVTDDVTGNPLDLTDADITFDGVQTVTIEFGSASGASFLSGRTYTVELVGGADVLRSAQGVELSGTTQWSSLAVVGDVTQGPTQGGTTAFRDPADGDALFVVFEETLDPASAETAAAYDLNGGNLALSATLVDPRAVRVVFGTAVTPGDTLDIAPAGAVDTAGNAAAGTISVAVTDDVSAPFVASSAAVVQVGLGGDEVRVTFDELLDVGSGLRPQDFVLTEAGRTLRVGYVLWDSQATTARVFVEDLPEGGTVDVTIAGAVDLAGNAPASALTTAVVVSGDATAPDVEVAYVNGAIGTPGTVVDVLFTEAIKPAFVTTGASWTSSDGATLVDARMLDAGALRLTFDAPLDPAATLTLAAGLEDLAGNLAASAIPVVPVR